MTSTLLWPRSGAVWLDSVAAENRPGRHGVWQRVVERRRLAEATAVLAWSPRALEALPGVRADAVVPVPVARSGPVPAARDIAAVTYGANPEKRRLDLVLAAWSRARNPGEKLVVAGLERYRSAFACGSTSIVSGSWTYLPPDFHAARGHAAVGRFRMKFVHAAARMTSPGGRPPKS